MKILRKSAATGKKQSGPRWLNVLVGHLERGERRLSNQQKKIMLLCFTLVTGACFLHLAISGAVSPENEYRQHHRQKPPKALQMSLPHVFPADSLQNKNLLP